MSRDNPYKNPTETAVNVADDADAPTNESPFSVIRAIQTSWKNNGRLKFILTAAGIFVAYLCVGMLQEKIMRGCYGDNCERFKYAVTLVGVQSLCAFIFIKTLDIISPEEKDSTHFGYYIGAAIANSSAMISSNMALRFVSYPMQVIFKSAKPIAVMAGGVLICKRYTIQRYFFVLMIVIGVIIFKLFESKDPKKSKKESMEVTQWEQYFGIGLLVLSLAMDGVLGAIQDRIRGVYAPTFRQMMLSMSAWVCVVTSGIVLVTGEFTKVFKFTVDHPNIIWHLLSFGIASTFGQLFIFTMVSCFGSLACSVTTTVRKFFSVVISIIIFQNPSTLLQWIGAVLVFAGLLFDAIFGKGRSKPDNQPTADTELGAVSENLLEKPKQDDAKPKNGEHQTQAQASV